MHETHKIKWIENPFLIFLAISSDCHRYYSVMHALIQVYNKEGLNKKRLAQSNKRLKKATERLDCRSNDIKCSTVSLIRKLPGS